MKEALKKQEPKPLKTFRDKYLAVVMMVAALLISSVVSAQTDSLKYSQINGYGFKYKRMAFDSVLMIPQSNSIHAPYRRGALRYRASDSTLQLWTGYQWNSILTGVGNGVDTAYMINDSLLTIETPDQDYFLIIPGRHWTLQGILNNGSTLTENETITLADSLTFTSGMVIIDNLNLPNLVTKTDTTANKPVVIDASGNVHKMVGWPISPSTTLSNVGSGYRRVKTADGQVKTEFAGYGIIKDSTTNTDAITDMVDTASTNHVVTQSDLNDVTPLFPEHRVPYYNSSNRQTTEAALTYNATTNKLSADSITSIKINTDSLRIAKSPVLADDTLLTRKANGNVGKLWNIGVTHLDNGTSATKNTVWSGNGKWEATGVHTFFKVDESNFPEDGDSIYTNSSLAGYQHYNIYREGVLQYMDTTDGVEIDTATGTITWHPPLVANERVQINADKLSPLRGQPFVQFDINTVPNVRAWFDATDAPTVTIATGVSQWDDKTPNNHDLASATGANQPAYFATGGSGNQSFIRFNSTDFLNHTFATPDSAAITAYMVMKQATYTNSYVIYQFGTVGGPDGLIPSQNTDMGSPPLYWGYGNYDGVGQNGANLNTGWGEWQLVKAVFRGGNANYVTKNKEGAMMYAESPEGIGAGSPSTLKNEQILFQYAYDSWDISEAVIITGEPSPTNDNNIKSYLMSKYQIPAKKSLIFLGDSHTQGIQSGTTTGRSYALTTTKDQGYDMMNMGISGTVAYPIGSFGGITNKNLSDIYTQFDQYIASNDQYIIFQYGTNDGTSPTNAAWVTSYKASIQHFLDAGVPASKIIICTPPYNTNATYATNLANAVPVIQGIATDLGIQLCDFYTYLQGLSLDINAVAGGDGIHGDLTIHNAMSDLLKTFLP